MVRAVLVCFTVSLSMAFSGHVAFGQETTCLRIGSAFGAKHSVDSVLENNLRSVLKPLNVCIEPVYGPAKRLTETLLRGEIDGEMIRVKEYGNVVGETAMLVAEPLNEVAGYLITQPEIEASERSVNDLSIGILRGVKWHQVAVAGSDHVSVANSMEQLTAMFDNRRVDGILIGGFLRDDYPQYAALPAKVVYRSTVHFVLHRRHAALAGRIGTAIQAYRQHGCSFFLSDGGPACAGMGALELEYRDDFMRLPSTVKDRRFLSMLRPVGRTMFKSSLDKS